MSDDRDEQRGIADRGTDDRGISVAQRRVAERDEAEAKPKPAAKKPAPPKPKPKKQVKRLYIGDPENAIQTAAEEKVLPAYFPNATKRYAKSKKQLLDILEEYSKIDDLIIWRHSAPGELVYYGGNFDFEKTPDEVKGRTMPKVKAVYLEGCSAGEHPEAMATFADAFGAERVSGWNQYHYLQTSEIVVPKGSTKATTAKALTQLEQFDDYWIKGTPDPIAQAAASFAAKPAKYKFVAEWFHQELSDAGHVLPPKSDPGRNKSYRPRAKAVEKTITRTDAKKLSADYKKGAPNSTLTHYTVKL